MYRRSLEKWKDILFMAGWQFLNLSETRQLSEGFFKEHVRISFDFYQHQSSALMGLLWCVGPKVTLGSSDSLSGSHIHARVTRIWPRCVDADVWGTL